MTAYEHQTSLKLKEYLARGSADAGPGAPRLTRPVPGRVAGAARG